MERKLFASLFKGRSSDKNKKPQQSKQGAGAGQGSNGPVIPASEIVAFDPDFMKRVKGMDPERVLFVTGTNGKTMATNIITHILQNRGFSVISSTGSKGILRGKDAMNAKEPAPGKVTADFCVIEIDERYLGQIADQLPCANLLVTNLQKDQVQRNGDPDFVYRRILKAVKKHDFRLFLNADEPRSASLGVDAEGVVFYGAVMHENSFKKGNAFVTMPCPNCRHGLEFRYYNNDGIGGYSCPRCGYRNPKAKYLAQKIDFRAGVFRIGDTDFLMPFSFSYMLYNYVAAIAAACELADISLKDASMALASFENVEGRLGSIIYRSLQIKFMRFKQENPETLQNFVSTVAADKRNKVVCIGLGTVNDLNPGYVNTFYAYDCDYSELIASNVEKYIFVTETVCYDAANALIYAGVDPAKVEVIPTDDEFEILEALWNAGCDNVYLTTDLERFRNMKAFEDTEADYDFYEEYEDDEYEYEYEDDEAEEAAEGAEAETEAEGAETEGTAAEAESAAEYSSVGASDKTDGAKAGTDGASDGSGGTAEGTADETDSAAAE